MPDSICSSRQPCDEIMSHTRSSARTSASSSRTAYGAPDAPVIATTTGARSRHRASTRPASTKAKKVTLNTPFIVKNAASSRERSAGRTSECS